VFVEIVAISSKTKIKSYHKFLVWIPASSKQIVSKSMELEAFMTIVIENEVGTTIHTNFFTVNCIGNSIDFSLNHRIVAIINHNACSSHFKFLNPTYFPEHNGQFKHSMAVDDFQICSDHNNRIQQNIITMLIIATPKF
jgi:hypothetical protein